MELTEFHRMNCPEDSQDMDTVSLGVRMDPGRRTWNSWEAQLKDETTTIALFLRW